MTIPLKLFLKRIINKIFLNFIILTDKNIDINNNLIKLRKQKIPQNLIFLALNNYELKTFHIY